jgi:hypothetical protein
MIQERSDFLHVRRYEKEIEVTVIEKTNGAVVIDRNCVIMYFSHGSKIGEFSCLTNSVNSFVRGR